MVGQAVVDVERFGSTPNATSVVLRGEVELQGAGERVKHALGSDYGGFHAGPLTTRGHGSPDHPGVSHGRGQASDQANG